MLDVVLNDNSANLYSAITSRKIINYHEFRKKIVKLFWICSDITKSITISK